MRIIFFPFVDFWVIVKLLYGLHLCNNYPDLGASEISHILRIKGFSSDKKAIIINPLLFEFFA